MIPFSGCTRTWPQLLAMTLLFCGFCTARAADAVPRLPTQPIHAQLTYEPDLLPAKWGDRPVTLQRLATSPHRMRLRLGTLMGEFVEVYEFNMARIRGVTLGGEPPYAHRVEIYAVDHPDKGYVSDVINDHMLVSQDILDLLSYSDFTFSMHTYGMRPLPLEYYAGKTYPYTISVGDQVHIHRRNPGVLAPPGSWGWDVPGSPDWKNTFSFVDIPLSASDYGLPPSRAMTPAVAREGFKRMLFRHHVQKQDVFVLNRFTMQNVRVDLSRILNAIYRRNPATYQYLTARTSKSPEQDEQGHALLAGLERRFAEERDEAGVLRLSPDSRERLALVGRAMAAFKADMSAPIWDRWQQLKQEAADAPWRSLMAERQLSALPALAAGADPGQPARESSAALARSVRVSPNASTEMRRKIEEIDRLIQLSAPIEILSPADGSSTDQRIVLLRASAPSEANNTLTVNFNGASQSVQVSATGELSTSIVLKRGDNEIAVCRESACKSIQVTGTMPELALMATLTWDRGTDLDLYMQAPNGRRCDYKRKTESGLCSLDIDDQQGGKPENISVPTGAPPGVYQFWVQNFSGRSGYSGTLKVYRRGVLEETRSFTTSASKDGVETRISIDWSP